MILWKTEILKNEWVINLAKKNIINEWPFSVVVITFALHAKGPGFEPRNDHLFLFWNSYLVFTFILFLFWVLERIHSESNIVFVKENRGWVQTIFKKWILSTNLPVNLYWIWYVSMPLSEYDWIIRYLWFVDIEKSNTWEEWSISFNTAIY